MKVRNKSLPRAETTLTILNTVDIEVYNNIDFSNNRIDLDWISKSIIMQMLDGEVYIPVNHVFSRPTYFCSFVHILRNTKDPKWYSIIINCYTQPDIPNASCVAIPGHTISSYIKTAILVLCYV